MQTNYTYTNLYPTINYSPIQDYDLMDEANIRDTLNSRLASINFQENKINKSLLNIAISNPKYLNEFFSRYSGIYEYKKFVYKKASDYLFSSWFNSEAVHSSISNPVNDLNRYVVFYCTNFGAIEEKDFVILVFDSSGKLIPFYNYIVKNISSGLVLYVRAYDKYDTSLVVGLVDSNELNNTYTLKVVVLKKKNSVDITNRFISKVASASQVNGTTFNFDNLDTNKVIPIIDTNYYSLFKKIPNDTKYRQVYRENYNFFFSDQKLLGLNISEPIVANTEYIINNTIDYYELDVIYDYNGTTLTIVTQNIYNNIDIESIGGDVNFNYIPLIRTDGKPISFKRVYDIYLWINGYKLTPGVDFFIQYNNTDSLRPPSITLCENKKFPIGDNQHIRLIINQPYHPKNLCAYFDNITDKGVIDFGKDIVSYSAKGVSLCFSDGKFVSPEDITVINNTILHINKLNTNRRFEYNFNYLVSEDVNYIVDEFNNYESDLDKFIRYSNYTGDVINDYLLYNNIEYTLESYYDNIYSSDCASNNFIRFVNVEVDYTNIYRDGYNLIITSRRKDDSGFILDCNYDVNYANDVIFDCNTNADITNIYDANELMSFILDCNIGINYESFLEDDFINRMLSFNEISNVLIFDTNVDINVDVSINNNVNINVDNICILILDCN